MLYDKGPLQVPYPVAFRLRSILLCLETQAPPHPQALLLVTLSSLTMTMDSLLP